MSQLDLAQQDQAQRPKMQSEASGEITTRLIEIPAPVPRFSLPRDLKVVTKLRVCNLPRGGSWQLVMHKRGGKIIPLEPVSRTDSINMEDVISSNPREDFTKTTSPFFDRLVEAEGDRIAETAIDISKLRLSIQLLNCSVPAGNLLVAVDTNEIRVLYDLDGEVIEGTA